MQDNEIWMKIQHPLLKNYYLASNLGRIKSTIADRKEKILAQFKIKRGYMTVNLSRLDGDNRPFFVHRAIAMAFLGMPENTEMQVNHKNGIKTDNRIENLEWVTRKQNIEHAIENGLVKYNPINGWIGDTKNIYTGNKKPLLQIKNGIIVNRFSSQMEAAIKNGIAQSGINHCLRGRLKFYKGYKWEYDN